MGADTDGEGRATPDLHAVRAGYILGGNGSCIADARHHVPVLLDQAHDEDHLHVTDRVRELTQLVDNELVTNARTYAPGPAGIELRITDRPVEVVVWDSESTVPAGPASRPGLNRPARPGDRPSRHRGTTTRS